MTKDLFAHKADSYEKETSRVNNVKNIAQAILDNVHLTCDMKIMDFGSGTGLLLEEIAPHVQHITAIDVSTSMNQQLAAKQSQLACELEILPLDLTTQTLERQFDGIISSMTLHHIQDIPALFKTFYALLNEQGFLALADLDKEDGSFHTEDTGVFHFGFEHHVLIKAAEQAGFKQVKIIPASTIHKPQCDYDVFLLTAYK